MVFLEKIILAKLMLDILIVFLYFTPVAYFMQNIVNIIDIYIFAF